MGCISPLLAVRNIKKSIEFYTNSLGFKMGMAFPDATNPEYIDLSKDGMVIMKNLASAYISICRLMAILMTITKN
jgi:uncharacterized glyoxalase superfamily protein PhnB